MNRARILKGSLLIVVIFAVLIGATVVVQGTTLNSSAATGDVIRQPRPHPKSHLQVGTAATSIDLGDVTLYPRPHPKSHIKIAEPGSMLYPRPHPTSHIDMVITRP